MRQKSENLYGDVRGYLCKAIYKGQYEDGELLPPERKLAEELGEMLEKKFNIQL